VISEFRVGITVRRPRPEVASVMFDLHYLPAWLIGIRHVEVISGEPPHAGASVALMAKQGPVREEDVFEIVEHQHDLILLLQAKGRALTLELEGVPVGTVAWLWIEIERTGLRRLLSRWIDHRERQIAIRDLRRLKQFIESGEYRNWWVEAEAEADA
jgi:hypothetical protein